MVIQVRGLRTNGTKVYANNLIYCFKYEFTTIARHQFITDVAMIFEFQTEPKKYQENRVRGYSGIAAITHQNCVL